LGAINDYLEVVESLRSGKKRSCPHCGEVKDSKLYPFPRRPECYLCYEKVTGRYLQSFRKKLGLGSVLRPKQQRHICIICQYESAEQLFECPNCKGTIFYVKEGKPPVRAPKTSLVRKEAQLTAVDRATLENYLTTRRTIRIRYKSQRQNSANNWRLLNVVDYDDTYIRVRGFGNVLYKYRRDRVLEIR
jgi:predicted RNA-binding Zn-ribbon protein involved in translation (DUF1610 family)